MIGNLTCIFWILYGTYIGVNSVELFVDSSGEYNFTVAVIYGAFVFGLFQLLDLILLKLAPKIFDASVKRFKVTVGFIKERKRKQEN